MNVVTKEGRHKIDSLHRDKQQKQPSAKLTPKPAAEPAAWNRWLQVGAIALLLVAAWLLREPLTTLLTILGDQDAVSASIRQFGILGPLVLSFAQLIQVLVVIIPGHVFLVVAGYLYGFPAGFLLNLVSIVLASQLGFLLARWAGRPLISRFVSVELLDRWYEIGKNQGFVFFTISFLLPIFFPTDLMNFVAGLSGITSRKFFAANLIGRFPGAVLLTLIGSHGLSFGPWAWLALGVAAALLFLIGRYAAIKIEQRYITGRQLD